MLRRNFILKIIVFLGITSVASMALLNKRISVMVSELGKKNNKKLSVKRKIKKLVLSDKEWKKRLTVDQYDVLRQEGTERPFSSELNDEKREGIYHCVGCDLELFTSKMKFDSGTGWPSFFTSLEGVFKTKVDFKLIYPRTEYHCARCGGHHGHIFNDGPPPTGERWCNNGVALKFIPGKIDV